MLNALISYMFHYNPKKYVLFKKCLYLLFKLENRNQFGILSGRDLIDYTWHGARQPPRRRCSMRRGPSCCWRPPLATATQRRSCSGCSDCGVAAVWATWAWASARWCTRCPSMPRPASTRLAVGICSPAGRTSRTGFWMWASWAAGGCWGPGCVTVTSMTTSSCTCRLTCASSGPTSCTRRPMSGFSTRNISPWCSPTTRWTRRCGRTRFCRRRRRTSSSWARLTLCCRRRPRDEIKTPSRMLARECTVGACEPQTQSGGSKLFAAFSPWVFTKSGDSLSPACCEQTAHWEPPWSRSWGEQRDVPCRLYHCQSW